MKPRHIGDVKDVVLVIHCDMEAALFLAKELPQADGFTREIWKAVHAIEAELAAVAALEGGDG